VSIILEQPHERPAIKGIIGATTQRRAGLGSNTFERFANAPRQRKWATVVNEMRAVEWEQCLAAAAQQSQQS